MNRHWLLVLLLALTIIPGPLSAADDNQKDLIATLQSAAPPGDKAIACKKLAIYGTEDAVPVLAPLLADKALSSWARIALEAIPGPAADDALRQALGTVQGRLRIAVINSIGVRRDPKAIKPLAAELANADLEVASAAAVALGRIGGSESESALKRSLRNAPPALQPGLAHGCILCAEQWLAGGKPKQAASLYDLVRKAPVPRQTVLEATRGAILARGSGGVPLLLEQLRSADKARFAVGLSTARELAGTRVTEALAAELDRATPARQPLVLLALADRHDPAGLPSIVRAAGAGTRELRLAAVVALERVGNTSCISALVETAGDPDPKLSQAAKSALVRLPGDEIEPELLARLSQSSGKSRCVLLEVAGQRRLQAALNPALASARDADAAVRVAAIRAIGLIGHARQLGDLAKLLREARTPGERGEIETAFLAISSREGAECVAELLPLMQGGSQFRLLGMQALASAGGSAALAAVVAATRDQDEAIQDEAVRILSSWPNTWPEDAGIAEPLLTVARSDQKAAHQILALRGYLQFLQADKKLQNDQKLSLLKEAQPLVNRAEEKQMTIAILQGVPTGEALDQLIAMHRDAAVAQDVCSAVLEAGSKKGSGLSKEHRRKALEFVQENSGDETLRKKAGENLKKLE